MELLITTRPADHRKLARLRNFTSAHLRKFEPALTPSELGGPELDAVDAIRVIEELARADGSVGWCVAVACGMSRISAYLDDAAVREVFGDGRKAVAGVFIPSAKAIPSPGGYRITGRWSYGSFIKNSEWVTGAAVIMHGDAPRPGVNGLPDLRFFFFPTREAKLIDNWRVIGLRGTGSIDFAVKDLFVPGEFAVCPFTAPARYNGTLYAAPIFCALLPAGLAAVAIGVARGAVDEFCSLAEAKTPTMSKSKLRDRPHIQTVVAKAEVALRAGRAFLFEAVDGLWSELEARQPLSLRQRALVRLAVAHSVASSSRLLKK